MTEDEIKMTWCPHARVPDTDTGGLAANRTAKGTIEARHLCLGSACSQLRHDFVADPHHPGKLIKSDTEVYCGIAGKP